MVDKGSNLKTYQTSCRVGQVFEEEHEPGLKDCLDAMSSHEQDLSSKYSLLQTTPFSVSDILSPFEESYRQQYGRNLDSTGHYMGPTR